MWWDLAINPKVILAYYSHPPLLHEVEVHSLQLNRDGPTLELLVEMPRFPDCPSSRWPVGANASQATLRFFDLRGISLSSWGTVNTGNLYIKNEGGMVRFRFDCPTARLAGDASFFEIIGVTGYIKSST
jgi:hypothetical protein